MQKEGRDKFFVYGYEFSMYSEGHRWNLYSLKNGWQRFIACPFPFKKQKIAKVDLSI